MSEHAIQSTKVLKRDKDGRPLLCMIEWADGTKQLDRIVYSANKKTCNWYRVDPMTALILEAQEHDTGT